MSCGFLDSIQFSSISIGLKGRVLLSGLTCATPLPIMVFLGIKVDLPVFNTAEIILVHPGKILTLFLVTIGMEICSMYNLFIA